MAGGEGGGMDTLGRGVVWGGALAPKDRLRWPAKFSPVGVVFHPARHP